MGRLSPWARNPACKKLNPESNRRVAVDVEGHVGNDLNGTRTTEKQSEEKCACGKIRGINDSSKERKLLPTAENMRFDVCGLTKTKVKECRTNALLFLLCSLTLPLLFIFISFLTNAVL